MEDFETLTVEKRARVVTISLNRPDKRNALSIRMRSELVACLDSIETDEVGAVILTGAGETFCAGFDLSEFTADNMEQIFADAAHYHRRVHGFARPLIAAVNGRAFAGGMDLALLCDLRVASTGAAFAQPQVRMGIPASYDLMRGFLPESVCRELCLTGGMLTAVQALQYGLVSRVVPPERLMDESIGLAEEIAASSGAVAMKQRFLSSQPALFGN